MLILIYLSFSFCMFLDSKRLLSSEKLEAWRTDTAVFDFPMESTSYLKLWISNLIILFLVSSSSQSRLLSFTCSLCLSSFYVILFRALQISFISYTFNSYIIKLLTKKRILEKNLKKRLPIYFSCLEFQCHSIIFVMDW